MRQPSNTVNACCSGDPAFVKVAPARVGLACLGAFESKEIADEEEKAAGEDPLLQRVRQRALQHQGHANAHQQVVHLRRG